METALAAIVGLLNAVLTAFKPYLSTIAAFFAGKGVAEYKAMEDALKQERAERDLVKELNDFRGSLSDGELRRITNERIKAINLRLKARAADRSGGYDD
jgi:hypothetical protein